MNNLFYLKRFALTSVVLLCSTLATAADFWEPANGPYDTTGHTLSVIALASSPQGVIYAAVKQNIYFDDNASLYNVFRSTDKGVSWNVTGTHLIWPFIFTMVASKSGALVVGCLYGVYRSDDEGSSWSKTLVDSPGAFIALSAVDSGIMYAGTEYGRVYQSTDDGKHWQAAPADPSSGTVYLGSIRARNGTLYAQSGATLAHSTDNGLHWITHKTRQGSIHGIAVDSSGTVFIGTDGGWQTGGGVDRTTDDGVTWIRCDTSINDSLKNTPAVVSVLCVSKSGVLYAGTTYGDQGRGVFSSMNQGSTWRYLPIPSTTNPAIRAITIDSASDVFVGSEITGSVLHWRNGGLYRTSDSSVLWSNVSGNMAKIEVQSIRVARNSTLLLGAPFSGVYRSTDGLSQTWALVSDGLPFDCSKYGESFGGNTVNMVIDDDRGKLYAGTDCGLYQLDTLNMQWKFAGPGLPHSQMWGLYADSTGLVIAGSRDSGSFRSTDYGNTWTNVSNLFHAKTLGSVIGDRAGHVFTCTDNDTLFRSDDQGMHWQALTNGLQDSAGDYQSTFDSSHHGMLYASARIFGIACASNGVVYGRGLSSFLDFYNGQSYNPSVYRFYKSTDFGEHWDRKGLDGQSLNAFAIDSAGCVYVGFFYNNSPAPGGVLRSCDGATTWDTINGGFPERWKNSCATVNDLAVDHSGYLWAATTHGVYKSAHLLSSVSQFSPSAPENTPQNCILSVTPNPAADQLTIEYSLSENSDVSLKLYSTLGTLVKTFEGGSIQHAGDHHASGIIADVPPGYYFCEMKSARHRNAFPVVIVR